MRDDNSGESEAEGLFDMVSGRYGARLSPEELEQVRKGVGAIVDAAASLRAVKLQDSDEPDTLFRPYRGEG